MTQDTPAALPVPTSATGGNWEEPTTVAQRLGDAMQLLCGGKRPPDDMVAGWLDNSSEDLQEFAVNHGPAWAQGIGLIDAAMVMVDQPTEILTPESDEDHEHRDAQAATSAAGGARVEDDMLAAVRMLEDGEWAEHFARTPIGKRLEDAVTALHSDLNEATAALAAQSPAVPAKDHSDILGTDRSAAHQAWAAFERLESSTVTRSDPVLAYAVRDFLMRQAGVGNYRAAQSPDSGAGPVEPVYWEYRWKDTHPQTVTSGQWYPWEKVEPRNGRLETVEARLAELRGYIAQGKCYEIRALYAAPQAALAQQRAPAPCTCLKNSPDYCERHAP